MSQRYGHIQVTIERPAGAAAVVSTFQCPMFASCVAAVSSTSGVPELWAPAAAARGGHVIN